MWLGWLTRNRWEREDEGKKRKTGSLCELTFCQTLPTIYIS